ncbi:MAG: Stp1/IreP family PP2C-type Ser/Thr phosphatase [Desulfobulbaceae bacterium]|nr:Stp1/IreP family PP2C-type Ser/Thr phosphatase [Desulfobulbaceae bacterium]
MQQIPSNKTIKVNSFGATDTGKRRTNNEDVFHLDNAKGIYLVADGMGGAAAGELAARMFADAAKKTIAGSPFRPLEKAVEDIKNAFSLANRLIHEHIEEYPNDSGMGCTGELFLLHSQGYVIGHLGDSRCYRFHNNQLQQLTKDHSFIQLQIDAGLITPEEARRHPMRNIILRSIGTENDFEIDIINGNCSAGEIFLLCSDGLTDMVEDQEIAEVLLSPAALSDKAIQLIQKSNDAGGKDNITVGLIEILP